MIGGEPLKISTKFLKKSTYNGAYNLLQFSMTLLHNLDYWTTQKKGFCHQVPEQTKHFNAVTATVNWQKPKTNFARICRAEHDCYFFAIFIQTYFYLFLFSVEALYSGLNLIIYMY